MKTFVTTLFLAFFALGSFAAQAAPMGFGSLTRMSPVSPPNPVVHKIACGWYVISGCYRGWRKAKRRARRIGAYVVNTSSRAFPNFRPGYYCAVFGPYGYSTAKRKSRYIRPSYIKNGC